METKTLATHIKNAHTKLGATIDFIEYYFIILELMWGKLPYQ